jgi:RNA polymerase sigma-70 factor (ECF subfamily)
MNRAPGAYNEGRGIIDAAVMTTGDHPPFEAVYAEFHPRILRYLARMIGFDEAEDAAQEVFAKVSRGLPEFRSESQLSTWIYRIATNTATDRVRSAQYRLSARSSSLEESCESEPANMPAPGACSAETQTIRDEMSGCVRGLLTELPEDYRTVLVLSEMEDLKDREIAEILGLKLQAVKIRLHRARARLRQSLETKCSFYRDGENTLLCDIKPAPPRP